MPTDNNIAGLSPADFNAALQEQWLALVEKTWATNNLEAEISYKKWRMANATEALQNLELLSTNIAFAREDESRIPHHGQGSMGNMHNGSASRAAHRRRLSHELRDIATRAELKETERLKRVSEARSLDQIERTLSHHVRGTIQTAKEVAYADL